MCKIISAYVTFETEDGFDEAEKTIKSYSGSKPLLLKETMKFKKASEPGNIIWETKHIRGRTLFAKVVFVVALIAILLFIAFGTVIEIKSYSA